MITKPLVENLPSYVKDTNHMLDIAHSFRFFGTHNYVFTMDISTSGKLGDASVTNSTSTYYQLARILTSLLANISLPPGHSVSDMLVSVICAGFRTTMVRRSMEARLIFRHKTLQPSGMNIDFAFL